MPIKAIIVANQTHTRFLIWKDTDSPEGTRPILQEVDDLMNPMDSYLAKDVWTNIQAGRNRGSATQAHGYDDHRQNHVDEFERRYCGAIAARGKALIEQYGIRTLILTAPPHLLGIIRRDSYSLWPKSLKIHELAKDLVKVNSTEIYQYLVTKNLLPVVAQVP